METYDCLNYGYGVHTIKVSLQDGEFKGSFTHTIGGNCKGAGLLDFDISVVDQESLKKHYKFIDCKVERPDDDNYLLVTLTDSSGETCQSEVEDDEFQNMIVGVEIIDFKAEAE